MPFKSEAQRRLLWAKRPDVARKWTDKYGSEPVHKNKKALARRLKKKGGKKRG